MKVDLGVLNLFVTLPKESGLAGAKITGIADSLNVMMPAAKPKGPCMTCTHVDFNDKDVMLKGSVFVSDTDVRGRMFFILCKQCVIDAQYFPQFEAQARICPLCLDDHSEKRPCRPKDIELRIKNLVLTLAKAIEQRDDLAYELHLESGGTTKGASARIDQLNEELKGVL